MPAQDWPFYLYRISGGSVIQSQPVCEYSQSGPGLLCPPLGFGSISLQQFRVRCCYIPTFPMASDDRTKEPQSDVNHHCHTISCGGAKVQDWFS